MLNQKIKSKIIVLFKGKAIIEIVDLEVWFKFELLLKVGFIVII